uniref:Uncharacterized protein n=1 Tax=Chromera velia CCMP2878 TaxID=1169474 RepID=A0A0G4HKN9_9ALVE|eukprot:Cvel_28491.t1-p1 / transcript=Cvel_28491.t1 / gene=Cvel_28491 / organism=Chromera_velia_CCMP2878 / gene_product=hypothetical protein / transcript_product=hypothetical protein / location=Cvel_scaffold3740:8173-8625(+) / protein_length=151 / sequence_SO=supercontig / SO=protein_coding / is_pseudo=false
MIMPFAETSEVPEAEEPFFAAAEGEEEEEEKDPSSTKMAREEEDSQLAGGTAKIARQTLPLPAATKPPACTNCSSAAPPPPRKAAAHDRGSEKDREKKTDNDFFCRLREKDKRLQMSISRGDSVLCASFGRIESKEDETGDGGTFVQKLKD